jgi:hypothetical protein
MCKEMKKGHKKETFHKAAINIAYELTFKPFKVPTISHFSIQNYPL